MPSIKDIFITTYNELFLYYQNKQIAYQVANQLIKLTFKYDYILIDKTIFIENELLNELKKKVNNITILNMPYQYIFGELKFIDVIIKIKAPILIPRIETEELISWIIDKTTMYKNQFIKIADFCSGSGCIGIALLNFFKNGKCTAFDICEKSVELSSYNAKINNVKKRYTIYKKDIYTLKKNKKYDIIISNPPYIALKDYNRLDKSVLEWESKTALTDGENGYNYILFLLKTSKNKLHKNALIAIEICYTYSDFILEEAKKIYPKELVFLWIDQCNKKRAIIISKGTYKKLFI